MRQSLVSSPAYCGHGKMAPRTCPASNAARIRSFTTPSGSASIALSSCGIHHFSLSALRDVGYVPPGPRYFASTTQVMCHTGS